MTEHIAVLTIVVFFIGALIIPLLSRLGPWVPHVVAVATAGLVLILNVAGLTAVLKTGDIRYELGGWAPPMGIELVLDPLSAFFALMMSGIALLVLVHARHPIRKELPGQAVAFYSAALLMLGGLSGIVLTGDLFNLYVFLEISALAGYALLGAGSPRAAVATYRYLIFGTVGASFYLLGVGLLFLATGTLNMADLTLILHATGPDSLIMMGLIFIVVGMRLKMALFPLHVWLPDVYASAVSSSAALIAPIGTKVAAYVLIRIFFDVMDPAWVNEVLSLNAVLGVMGAIGIIWGSIMAIAQKDLRQMLAYSSVSQVGYIALGIGLGNAYGFIGAVLHALNHACMKACLFLVCGNLRSSGRSQAIKELDHSLQRSMPWTTTAFTLSAISMIGLPPLAGFFSKWYLLLGSWENSNWIFIIVIIVSSLLNAVYFFRVIERLYLPKGSGKQAKDDPATAPAARLDRQFSLVFPAMALGVALLLLGLANVAIVRGLIQPMLPEGF